MDKKYLFFDIDGTLAAGGYGHTFIPDSTKIAIDNLRKAGHFLCIATGRAQAMAVSFMHELGFKNMVSDGGNGITINGEIIEIKPLNRKYVLDLLKECDEKGLVWGIQADNSNTRLVRDESFIKRTNDIYMKTRVIPDLNPENYENIYKAYIACESPTENSLQGLKKLPWYRFQKEYIFIEPSNKERGIRKMMDHYNADYKDAIVFGDSGNDLSMFTDEWTCVAMGNAIDELKKKADYVTTNVDEDGIYNACEYLGLF